MLYVYDDDLSLLWCIELPTEIRRQIKMRVGMRVKAKVKEKTRITRLLFVCVRAKCARVCLFVCLLVRKGTIVMKSVMWYCLASTSHLSAVIHGINLYIDCCHSMKALPFPPTGPLY